jgi:Holliday junction resolvasome RuvABC endonuclease subunit
VKWTIGVLELKLLLSEVVFEEIHMLLHIVKCDVVTFACTAGLAERLQELNSHVNEVLLTTRQPKVNSLWTLGSS